MLPSLPFFRAFRRRLVKSPTRSTPSLEDPIHYYHTPVEEALATPHLTDSEWSHAELWPEWTKPINFSHNQPTGLLFQPVPVPMIDKPSPLRHRQPSPPPQTVAPQDVFCDYDYIRRVLAEQEQPTSPSTCSTTLSTPGQYDDLDLPEVDPYTTLPPEPSSTRKVGTKAKREQLEDDVEEPDAKRRAISSPSPPPPKSHPIPKRSAPRQVGTKTKREQLEDDLEEPDAKRRAISIPSPPRPKSRPIPRRSALPKASRPIVNYSEKDHDADFIAPSRRPSSSASLPVAQEESEIETDDNMNMNDLDDDDVGNDGDFRPGCSKPRGASARVSSAGRKRAVRGKPGATRKVRSSNPARSPPKASSQKPPQPKSHLLGPCHCHEKACPHCNLTCPYVFTCGPRKGEVCRHFFESGRGLDFNRHKDMHGVHEWFASEILRVITPEEASWFHVECRGKTKGFVCPNHEPNWDGTIGKGDCGATFTRRDALKRHLDRHTCFNTWVEELTKKGAIDMGRVVDQSELLMQRLEPIIDSAFAKRKTGDPLTEEEEIVMKRLTKFEQGQDE